ncbi:MULTISPECIES: OmpA family protein [unclassified Mucilaginibacter]|uniref:OmpA family protein n=1 Tax=unclassified Mucilaginibacter TaxID=2617802 RepID=UPI0031F69B4B
MMKLKLKKTSLLLLGVAVGGNLFAQTPDSTTNSANYVKPFSGANNFRSWSIGLHGGMTSINTLFQEKTDYVTANERLGYGGYVKKQLLHGLGLQANFFRGHVQGSNPRQIGYPVQRFETKVKYAVDLSAVITVANINWLNNKSFIQPYVSVGAGNMGYTSTLTNNSGTMAGVSDRHDWFIPVGGGFKINLGPVVNLDLGYQVNFVNSDYLDQFVSGSARDKFGYAHAGLEFSLGKRSKPQLATHNPVSSMRTEYLMAERSLQMQLDQQKADNANLRSELNTVSQNLTRLTADSDRDGVFDINDKCPNTPAGTKVDGSGCPLPTPVTRVYVTEEDRKVVKEAIANLEFDLGKATIREKSFPSLNRVAELLVNKNFSLKLAGHTDNTGSDALNLKLSKDRAEAIKAYLVSQGANASRIEATGYGETQPIASNNTADGRQKNRRVEFTLF